MSVKSIILKITAGLLAVGILLGCIYFLSKPEKTIEKTEDFVVYSQNEEDVVSISVNSYNHYTLTKKDSTWVMEGMEGVGVNGVYADTLVKSMCNISSAMCVEADVTASQCGFDNPLVSVEINFTDKTENVYVGNASGEYYYLKIPRDDNIYLVSQSDLYMLFLDKIKYLDNTVLEIDTNLITGVQTGSLNLVKKEDDWYETNPYEYIADTDLVNKSILSSFAMVTATEIVKKEELNPEKEEMVQISLSDGTEVEFMVWDEGYIVFFDSDYAYNVAEENLAYLNISGFDLLMQYIAPVVITDVSEIELKSPSGKTTLSIEAPSSQAPVFYKNGKEVDEASFRNFYQSLVALKFTKEGEFSGQCEYEITFTKENGEKHNVKFADANESEFAIAINGEKGFMINKKTVTDVFGKLKNIEEL